MREILFRGKTILDNEWVIGAGVYKSEGHTWIITDAVTKTENRGTGSDAINPETVGQFTGLTDKNGKKIFEGDILSERPPMNQIAYIGFVKYDEERALYRFMIKNGTKNNGVLLGPYSNSYTVIGNIHDNPELLGGAKMDLKAEPIYCTDKQKKLRACEDCHTGDCDG